MYDALNAPGPEADQLLSSGPTVECHGQLPVRGLKFYIDGFAGSDWHLEQRVTRQEALRMLTWAPAYAAVDENNRGTIEAGKMADLTVLSRDIMTVPGPKILGMRVLMTVVGGQEMYRPERW